MYKLLCSQTSRMVIVGPLARVVTSVIGYLNASTSFSLHFLITRQPLDCVKCLFFQLIAFPTSLGILFGFTANYNKALMWLVQPGWLLKNRAFLKLLSPTPPCQHSTVLKQVRSMILPLGKLRILCNIDE